MTKILNLHKLNIKYKKIKIKTCSSLHAFFFVKYETKNQRESVLRPMKNGFLVSAKHAYERRKKKCLKKKKTLGGI